MKRFEIKFKDGDVLWSGEATDVVEAMEKAIRTRSADETPYFPLSQISMDGLDLNGVPVVPDIDGAILKSLERDGYLNMSLWHEDDSTGKWVVGCSTTHCRAGWAIHLAGKAGYDLERRLNSAALAGALIYAASRPGVPVPDFCCGDEEAMEDLRRCAGVA